MKGLLLLSLLASAVQAQNVLFKECRHPDFHNQMSAEWRPSSLYPHRSELEYHIGHEFHDLMMHVTDLKFEIHIDGDKEAAISETIPICSRSNHERAHCIRQVTESKVLKGTVQLNLPFTPSLGPSAVHLMEPSYEDEYESIYQLCSVVE